MSAIENPTRTIEESVLLDDKADQPSIGLVEIFSEGRPRCRAISLAHGVVELGRVAAPGVEQVDDDRVSRRHTRIVVTPKGVRITDLESRNGTSVDGRRIFDETFPTLPRILRLGQTLFRFTADVRPFLRGGVEIRGTQVIGPTLRTSREEIARAAATGSTVHLTGPSGSGKELAARAFAAAGGRPTGPFVAVNCAAIPAELAESLLFGAKKGAYTGATSDTEGHVLSADKGTLFLDEVGELAMSIQAKLLRVLEMREVHSLGAPQPRKVDVLICTATLKDLRAEVLANRFREDLYFRMGRPDVRLPALSDRLEEMPPLALIELGGIDPRLTLHFSFIEAAAMRAWPGNVREYLREVRQSARAALDAGRTSVEGKDLSATAGEEISPSSKRPPSGPTPAPTAENIQAALEREKGNVTRAAKALGLHRNQLRRWLEKNKVDPKTFGDAATDGPAQGDSPPPDDIKTP